MRRPPNKETRVLLKALQGQGFEVRYSSKGYPLVYTADGTFVTKMAQTPSDWRGRKNLQATLRRAGFNDGRNHQ